MPSRRTFLGSAVSAGLLGVGGKAGAQPGQAARLAQGFGGALITPDAPAYERARRTASFNPRLEGHPALIAVCADEADVARAIQFAREQGLEIAVRAGGHDVLALSTGDGLLIDLSRLQTIAIDPSGREVRVGAGVLARDLNAALAARGRAAVLGCDPRVGVAGLTLGGGLGWLAGRHGAACDFLVGARLVTAEGRVISVGPNAHPELLWALRGGGGNFGVVTELTLALHPAPPVVKGILALPGNRIADFMRFHRDYVREAGDALDLETFIFAPAGAPVIFVKTSYSGDPARADRVLAPLRGFAPALADGIAPAAYDGVVDPTGPLVALYRPPVLPSRPDDRPGQHSACMSAAPLSDAAAEMIAERLALAEGGWVLGFGHVIHGAAARVGLDHSPLRRPPQQVSMHFDAYWRRREDAEPCMAWAEGSTARLRPHADPGYVNLLSSSDPAVVRAVYGEAWPRLRQVKRSYDPDNIFRRNRNILPARGNAP